MVVGTLLNAVAMILSMLINLYVCDCDCRTCKLGKT